MRNRLVQQNILCLRQMKSDQYANVVEAQSAPGHHSSFADVRERSNLLRLQFDRTNFDHYLSAIADGFFSQPQVSAPHLGTKKHAGGCVSVNYGGWVMKLKTFVASFALLLATTTISFAQSSPNC